MVGTQTEMLKLAKDMGVIDKKVKSFGDMSFDQSILAIHKLQEQLEIAGVAGDEALTTMTGSIGMLKASWDNFMSGQGDLGKVVDSATIAFKNILRIVDDAMPAIVENIIDWMPQLFEVGTDMLGQIAQRNNGKSTNFNECCWRNTNEYRKHYNRKPRYYTRPGYHHFIKSN